MPNIKIILCVLLLSTVVYSQEELTKVIQSTDEGSWVGLRAGFQTKGNTDIYRGTIGERWSLFAMYEYRFDNPFSYTAEYQLFRQRHKHQPLVSALNIGLKCRFYLKRSFNLSTEVGVALGKLGGYIPWNFYYGGSLEFLLQKKLTLHINTRSFIVPDYGYFLSLGLNYQLAISRQ